MTASSPEAVAAAVGASPRIRVDELDVVIRRIGPNQTRYALRPGRHVTAAEEPSLPLFEGWTGAELVVHMQGLATGPFEARLDLDGEREGPAMRPVFSDGASPTHRHFTLELVVPLRAVRAHLGERTRIGVEITPGDRVIHLLRASFVSIPAPGPVLTQLDLDDATNTLLFAAPARRRFDLQNPEEGFWAGSGTWRLCVAAHWNDETGRYLLEKKPSRIQHPWRRTGDATDLLYEDAAQRDGTEQRSLAELLFNTSHPDVGDIPPEGRDIALGLSFEHRLFFGEEQRCLLEWSAPMPVRVRAVMPMLKTFQRLSAVGIDFGTSSTVAAYYQKGYRSLLRIGSEAVQSTHENPTYLLIEDHARLWQEMAAAGAERRFPNLLRVVLASAAAHDEMPDFPNAVVGELKSLPERVTLLDESPQLRDRERQSDFLLDEQRVRVLIRTYAYLLGRAINRPGQDVYLNYWLTYPAKLAGKTRQLLEEELRAGILLSIPQAIPAENVVVEMRASEPEAFAAEVCPELANDPALEPLLSKFGELRFAVFDFGGGTLDLACGRFRPATEAEMAQSSASTVVETLQVGGDDHLGGDYLTHELVWLSHQHEAHLPEMEEQEVPMMRPPTVPANNLASKPFLYKRSLSGRQNQVRFQRALELERVKRGPGERPADVESLLGVRLDGTDVQLHSLNDDPDGLQDKLQSHLASRIRDGARLLSSMLKNTTWGGDGDWREQGVVLLLAGNASRAELVEKVLAEELGPDDLKVWRPGSSEPFQQVVLFELEPRKERGVTVVGVTPKTAVALGALRIANREVHLVRQAQGFSYFVGDLRGFPPKYVALIGMGAMPGDPNELGPHYVDFGTWDGQKPLRVCKEYEEKRMTSNDSRLSIVPTGLPRDVSGNLRVCVVSPEELALVLETADGEQIPVMLNLAKFVD